MSSWMPSNSVKRHLLEQSLKSNGKEAIRSTGQYLVKNLEHLSSPFPFLTEASEAHYLSHLRKTINMWILLGLSANGAVWRSVYFSVVVNKHQLKSCTVIRQDVLCSALSRNQPSAWVCWSEHCACGKGRCCKDAWQPPAVAQGRVGRGFCSGLISPTTRLAQLCLPSSRALINKQPDHLPTTSPFLLVLLPHILSSAIQHSIFAQNLEWWLVQ